MSHSRRIGFWVLAASLTLSACSSGQDAADGAAVEAKAQGGNKGGPIADAGPDISAPEGSQVGLDGSKSRDEGGQIVSFEWKQVGSGPRVTLSGADSPTPSFTAPQVTDDTALTFRLKVRDNDNKSAQDEVVVTVTDATKVSVHDASAREGDSGPTPMAFTVQLAQARTVDVAVQYRTEDGSARAGSDYVAASGSVTIARGQTQGTITVQVTGDAFDENDETFRVVLTGASGAVLGDSEATGTILDDDDSNLLRAGAAKRSVTPAQAHINGIVEPRLDGTTHLQKFNLGGFGVNPLQNLPDDPGPIGAMQQLGEALTQPAECRVFGVSDPAEPEKCRKPGSRGAEHTHVRALVIEQPGGTRVAFVTLDAIGAGNVIQNGLKKAVNDAACAAGACFAPVNTPPEQIGNIVFGQTHSHAGADLQGLWGGVPQDWIQNVLYKQAVAAVAEALADLRAAHLTMQQGKTQDFNNYRRPRYDVNADADGTLTLLRAVADDGTPVGSILQYNAHPTSINEDPRFPHADYIQGAMDWLEDPATGTGGVALYYNGPIADASPSGSRPGCVPAPQDLDYGNVRCRGEGIANAALKFGARELAPTLAASHVEVTLPITNAGFLALGLLGSFNRYYDFLMLPAEQIPGIGPLVKAEMVNLPQLTPVARTLVSRITIGDAQSGPLEIVTIPGEATNTFGQYIRGLAPGANMMLLGLTQNSFGYILPEEEFNYVNPDPSCARVHEEPFCNSGLIAPFTGYEENVSLGPLTAPLLRIEGYNKLFPTTPEQNIPPPIAACQDPLSEGCILNNIGQRLDYIQRSIAEACRDPDHNRNTNDGLPEPFCALLDPETPFHDICLERGLPDDTCRIFGTGSPDTPTEFDTALSVAALDATARGCDMLDPAHCLLPFPSDHFTVAAPAGSPQSKDKGGTGKRINIGPFATPRNSSSKPIDPTEWNRNDGYSPGQMIVTYVPGLATNPDGTIPGAPPITDLSQSLDPTAAVQILEVPEPPELPVPPRHLAWAESDLNAGMLLHVPMREFSGHPADDFSVPNPKPAQPALIIRPGVNFREGRRYVVVLRNLKDGAGNTLGAQTAFRACRDKPAVALPPIQQRCLELDDPARSDDVFDVLAAAGIPRDNTLYLAWDFTVASTNNNIGRLRHMRDDAFVGYLGDAEDTGGNITAFGRAPKFEVTEVFDYPANHPELVREIKGTFTVPSYVVPADPSPADGQAAFRELVNQLPQQLQDQIERGVVFAPIEASSPPNRLYFNPADGFNPSDPQGSRFGDGLPDRSGELSSNFTCRIAKSTLSNKGFAQVAETDVRPSRPSLYGHGLLGDQSEINQDQLRRFGNEHNMMFCATDWFGFASGDLPNVLTTTLDMSNFPVIPDGTQQGILNQMFLARLLRHPQGFASHSAFRVGNTPVFDHREVYYDGNSQGGITGGAVIAASKDINRGALGVPGMNYSTLLTRSVDFDLFSVPLYLSYPDDLDRNLVFSMIQMLWDRSENNGYAHHMTDNAAFHGPDNEILLHPAFGDHQVTMWSADVMARTVGARVDRTRVDPARHPDAIEYFEIEALDYANAQHSAGSGLVIWDAPWTSSHDHCAGKRTDPPPIGNVPPREQNFDPPQEKSDPHECPRREVAARCQKSHFLHSPGQLADVGPVGGDVTNCPALPSPVPPPGADIPVASQPDYGGGVLGAVARFMAELNDAIAALLGGDSNSAFSAIQVAFANLADNLLAIPEEGGTPGAIAGTDQEPADAVTRAASANRDVEPVVLTGDKLGPWSVPAAIGSPYPYPSGAGLSDGCSDFGDGEEFCRQVFEGLSEVRDPAHLGEVRDAHNGVIVYPPPGTPAEFMGVDVTRVAAYRWDGAQFVEAPVQVDQRFPYFLANARSGFSFYSGTDEELTYEWDVERWGDGDPADPIARYAGATQDPVTGLDHDDEVVFMARDAGTLQAPPGSAPADAAFDAAQGLQEVVLRDPLDPSVTRYVYLGLKKTGATGQFFGASHYVNYGRDDNADQWIDRHFFPSDDPEKLGSSNRGYGPNRIGTVQPGEAFYGNPGACTGDGAARTCTSDDRFPRDGVTVTTDAYLWRASGRWMVRGVHVARPGLAGVYGPDLVDRWKGRAFQQSPDSVISLVGFEDEQTNWEANSTLLGERCGPVRCMREVWGADSGTNVTKTETFYRDAVVYRFHVRVHPIPPDGLYTSWDYNRSAMVPGPGENVPGGRYFTALRPQGVPVDGINDDVGQVDGFAPIMTPDGPMCPSPADDFEFIPPDASGRCPAFFDTADLTFNLPLAFDNWEQVSGKGDAGSLVYTFEIKGATSLLNPLVVPYYRDDSCLDDGTGDDPVPRPFPGDSYRDGGGRVPNAYRDLDGNGAVDCHERQGAYGSHGVHYFVTGDTDNNFVLGKPNDETDSQQWQFMVPTATPRNVGEPHANVVRVPLQATVVPRLAADDNSAAADLGDLCSSYGVGATSPLCGLLERAHVELQDGCQGFASAQECSLLGGNLHALLDACYARNPGESELPMCRVMDAFVGGATAWCRQVSAASGGAQRPELCALIGGVLVSEEALEAYEQTWTHKALLLQNKLGYGLPLVHNSIIATHNSFNASDDNTPPTLSGSDYNQWYDLVGQLRMDVRAIEIDVHWAPGRDGTPDQFFREPMVCHGLDGSQMNGGCTTEKPLREVLKELRTWLDAHPDEAIALYIEDDITGTQPAGEQPRAYQTTAQVIADEIGDLVFGPLHHGATCSDASSAAEPASWLNVSRRQILGAGKQLLLFTETCRADGGGWNALFHQKNDGNWKQGTQGSYDGFAYESGCVLPDEPAFMNARGVTWTRVWEDSTVVTATAGGGAPAFITPEVAHELMRCGMNMPSLDRLYPADGRLEGMVWSWAPDEPAADDALDCALHDAGGRFAAGDCAQPKPYACVADAKPDAWTIAGHGGWAGGATACPEGTHFGVPGNGHANEKLKDAKQAAGVAEVWLNYSDAAAEGAWEGDGVGGPTPRAAATFRTEQGLLHAVAGFLGDMVRAAGTLLGAELEAFVNAVAGALDRFATSLYGVLIANDEASLAAAFERLLANIRGLDANDVARDFARDLMAVLNGSSARPATGMVRAGVGIVDMTPDVGYCSGQYCDLAEDHFDGAAGGDFDPYLTHKTKRKSDGVQSRLSARAIVVEGANGKRIALVKTDNYLAQDNLMRRVGQILAEHDSSIGYPQILHHVTHNHTAAYSATLSWGPWLFEDAYDARFFENQARRIADAILMAEAELRPARMGATTVRHTIYKGNVLGPQSADDGTPAGYPREYGDHGLVVMRFDDVSNPDEPRPLAVWINWGEHPESLDGPNMHSADFLAGLERWVDRETGVPLVFSQGDVGSAERSGNPNQLLADDGSVCGQWPDGENAPTQNNCAFGEGVLRDWQHRGFVQAERNVRYLADAVVGAFHKIGSNEADVQVPASADFVVDYRNAWVPGPLSHPYPAVSNCRTDPGFAGDPGSPLLGLPDCARAHNGFGIPGEIDGDLRDAYEEAYQAFMANGGGEAFGHLAQIVGTMEAEGVPVADHYDAYSHVGLEENNRLLLQAFRLGDVLLASCACEAQADLILNLESRADLATNNVYDGFDWACLLPQHRGEAVCQFQEGNYFNPDEFPTGIPGSTSDALKLAHMRAQVHNDARGWDAPEYALQANSEPLPPKNNPADFSAIKGNFTREEIQAFGVGGYKLPVGVGHAGDYNGYTVSYREFMNRDHYRKSLTSYGAHTADYMVTRLVKMAAAMQGAPELAPEPHDALAQVDEARQVALSQLHGQATSSAFDAFHAALPPDFAPEIVAQPADITRFQAATFTWRGGSTAVDNPVARVQRELTPGVWLDAYDMSGEVQTRIHWPQGIPETLPAYLGQFEWLWTAAFEAYTAFPASLGGTAPGSYRFVVGGRIKQGTDFTGYTFESAPFTVSPWNGIAVENVSAGILSVTFTVPPITYPRSYAGAPGAFPFIRDDGNPRICETCTFRPWARQGRLERAEVVVSRQLGGTETVAAACSTSAGAASCTADVVLLPGDTAVVRAYDQDGNVGSAAVD